MLWFALGFLSCWACFGIAGAVLLWFASRSGGEPLTREQVEALREQARGALYVVRSAPELPSRLESLN